MIDLGVSELDAKTYTKCGGQKIVVKCPHCEREKEVLIHNVYNYHSIGCVCGDGFKYPSKVMVSFLRQLNVKFTTEKIFEWCTFIDFYNINKITFGIYDFVIEDMKLIIETDGAWHSKDNEMSGTKKEESEYIDFTKDKLAKENGYEVIRIDCNYKYMNNRHQYIKTNILNSKLNEIFDLSKIDWLKCKEFADNSNIRKEVYSLYKANSKILFTEIADKFKISESTVKRYLRDGTEHGWCDYNPDRNRIKALSREVEVLKDGISLGVFPSCRELDRKSEELFGIHINSGRISEVCNKKKPQYKGLIFKYIDQITE